MLVDGGLTIGPRHCWDAEAESPLSALMEMEAQVKAAAAAAAASATAPQAG
jgi:hypothetical protein